MRLEDIIELEERLGRDRAATALDDAIRAALRAYAAHDDRELEAQLEGVLRRLREAHPPALMPAPAPDAKPPPRHWADDEEGA